MNPEPFKPGHWIVLAWVDTIHTAGPRGPITRTRAHAAVWQRRGSKRQLARAIAHTGEPPHRGGIPGQRIYTFPPSEREPLQRARALILEETQA